MGSDGTREEEGLMAFWTPQPGPQARAAICPADVTMFGGSRGGGKSDCAAGRQIRGVEKYGKHWNGLIIRRKYKELAEMRRRFDELIADGLPAERTGGDQQTNYVRFSNQGQIALVAIGDLKNVSDYVGHQFCVAEGTKIQMADGSSRQIEDIQPGDMVHTLEGPKQVIKKADPYETPCVNAVTAFGDQVHPATHPILTAYGWQSYASLLEIYSREFEDSRQEYGQHRPLCVPARLQVPYSDLKTLLDKISIENHTSCKCATLLHGEVGHLAHALEGQKQLCEQALSSLYRKVEMLISYDEGCETRGLEKAQGFRCDCLPCSHLYDGQLPYQTGISLNGTPSPDDVGKSFPEGCKRGVLDNIPLGIRCDDVRYVHPYSGEVRTATEETFFFPCVMAPCGTRIVHDLTIADVNHYISNETRIVNKNTEITIDEGTTFPFFYGMVDKLKGSVRSAHGVPCRMFVTGNPGGPGHNQVKEFFKLGTSYGIRPETVITDDDGQTRIFIPSFLDDNRILCENDPKYVNRLKSIKDPALKKAWLDGDWDVYIGQAFLLTDSHIIDPIPIPDYAPIYMTFDWGYGKPFSVGWWWVDQEGRIYRFMEWYGCTGTPDEGLRITDSEIAKGIKEREEKRGIWGYNKIIRLAGPDCWNRKPNYQGGGQGPSTADTFAEYEIYLSKGDPSRVQKIQQFRERLLVPRDDSGKQIDRPMLQVYSTCKHFIQTIPALSMDEDNPEDIDTTQEDHIYDEACHICMARPLALSVPEPPRTKAQRHIDSVTRTHEDDYVGVMLREQDMQFNMLRKAAIEDKGGYSDVDGY